jgi:transposase-like protein
MTATRFMMNDHPHADDEVSVPTECPSCHSKDIKAADKVVDASSYWRCGACGDVWNVMRQRPANPYAYQRSYRR